MGQHQTDDPGTGRVLFSAAPAYLGHAARALGGAFPGAVVEELAPEVGRVALPSGEAPVARVAAVCRGEVAGGTRAPFVRHLASEDVRLEPADLDAVPEAAVALARERGLSRLALQVWSSGPVGRRAPDVRSEVEAALVAAGRSTARGGLPWVLSVCLTPAGVSVGVTARGDALADWPGGRIVLGRPAAQVSRAEWKLEELAKVFDWPEVVGSGGPPRALDLGASPGGWTRVLRSWGYEVWAVDPGVMAPAVAADPGVHHEAVTAGRFLESTDELFDVVVNDMRMVAEQSCRVTVAAASRVRPGGLAVLTLKVSPRRPGPVVERALAALDRAYTVAFVRQLFHNRNEVTVAAFRK